MHCRLSWSRDAATWQWVDKGGLTGADLIPLGAGPNDISKPGPNAFDSHMCAPCTAAVHSYQPTRCALVEAWPVKVVVMCVRCFAAMPVSVPEEGERIYYMVRPSPRPLLPPALF